MGVGEYLDEDATQGRVKRVTRGSYWESESATCYQCHHYNVTMLPIPSLQMLIAMNRQRVLTIASQQ